MSESYVRSERKFELELGGGAFEIVQPTRSYLGSENGGGVQNLGLYSPKRIATGSSVSGSLKVDLSGYLTPLLNFGAPKLNTTWAKFGTYYSKADVNQDIGTIDAGTGNRLLFPGPSGFGSGFFASPGNPAQNVVYSSEFSKFGTRFNLGQTSHLPSGLAVDTYASIGYAHTSFDERFSGTVIGRDFGYTSSAAVDQTKLRWGAGLGKDFPVQSGLTFNISGHGEIGLDYSRATGEDRLSLTGFADSYTNPSASRAALGYEAGVSAGFKNQNGFDVKAEFNYMRETGLPVFGRDGNNSTNLGLESGNAWSGTVRATFKY